LIKYFTSYGYTNYMKDKTNKTLPTGGGMKSGGKTLPRGKSEHLKQGGGLKAGGGMEGVQIKDDEYDDMFFAPAVAPPAAAGSGTP
jgi:hypothetical protein